MMKSLTKNLVTSVAFIVGCIVLISCNRNLSKLRDLKNETSRVVVDSAALEPTPITVSKPFTLDTLSYGFRNRSLIVASNPYFAKRVTAKINHFYKSKSYQTHWLFDQAPASIYYSVINTLKNADKFGLIAEDYDLTSIEQRLNAVYMNRSVSTAEIADLDIHISEMYFLFATHLLEGKVRNVGNGRNVWKRQSKALTMTDVNLLLETTNSTEFEENLQKIQPKDIQYARLQKALNHYQSLTRSNPANTFPPISVPRKIAPAESSAAIPLIRQKLSLLDVKVYPMPFDSATRSIDSLYYDPDLAYGIKLFQLRHGLEPDGIIGDKTLKFLNLPFKEMVNVIALNMDRLRWLPDYGDDYILVNVPEYKLRVYENREMELEMKVIVGSAQTATPIFADVLKHIVFSPTWTVPVSIIKGEIIPNLRANPEYYSGKNFAFYKNNVEIDPVNEPWDSAALNPYQYRVVQNPGRDNSLGTVKFMMPNNMSVYMHDTPNHRLFSKQYRALSHGCVRLAEPAIFAEYLLRDQKGWTAERISKAMNDSIPSTILLRKQYDVHIEYRTAWVDDNGALNVREDIYGHDRVQLSQLLPVTKDPTALVGME